MQYRFQWYIVRREMLLAFHTRVEYTSRRINVDLLANGCNDNVCCRTAILRVLKLLQFCQLLLSNPSIDLVLEYIFGKPMKHRFQPYIVCTEISSTKSPLVTMGRLKFTPKMLLSFWRSPSKSNTPIPRPTPLTTRNGIRMQWAVSAQYTSRTDRQTDGRGKSSVPLALRLLCW